MHDFRVIRPFAVAAAVTAALMFAAPALAQQPGAGAAPPEAQQQEAQQPAATQQQQATEHVSDEQVEKFAEAYTEVAQLRDQYTQQIVETEDPERATELQQEANQRMIEAVEGKGLSVGEYNSIAEAMDRDAELQERVLQQLQ
jgi:PPE-repeat protein